MNDLQMVTRADVDAVGIQSGNAEEGELPQPPMTLCTSPDGTQTLLVTTKHYDAELVKQGWTDAERVTEPARVPANRKPAGLS